MVKIQRRNKLLSFLASGVVAFSLVGTGVMVASASAEESNTATLSYELAKITSVADMADGAITFYTANSWAGYARYKVDDSAENQYQHPQVYINNIMHNNESDYELVNFRGGIDAVHTVGIWDEDVNRVVSLAYTATETGTMTMPETALNIVEATADATKMKTYNGSLGMYIVKGDSIVKPEDTVWTYYEQGQTYTIAEQTFEMAAGESVYVHFYSKKIDTSISNMSFVSFQYNPSFEMEAVPETVHAFNHVQKVNLDANNALVNNVQITDDDSTTYPFSYLYRSTGGSAAGFTGQESATQVMEMSRAGVGVDASQTWLCANESYSAFMPTGQIVTVAVTPDPNNVILGFTSPYDGALTISDIAFKYNIYPNATNDYKFYETPIGQPFKGYAFRVLLNGKTVWPVNGGWDKSLAKLYETETDGFAAGDLIGLQSTDNIGNILVKKYDKVYFEITRADFNSPQNCDVIDFNPTFTIDTAADMSEYVSYTTAADYFDISNTNELTSQVSYWSVDTSAGLYNNATYKLMEDIDYATLAFTSGFLDDYVSEIGWNYFRPAETRDAAIAYLAPASGNLTISAESFFRGGNLALWEYFDIINNGNLLESDGVRIRIEVNGERVWPADNTWKTYRPTSVNKGVFDFEDVTIGVQEGDQVMIRVNCIEADLYDGFNFNPVFGLKETDTPMENPEITVADPGDEDNDSGNSSNSGNTGTGNDENTSDNNGNGQSTLSGCNGCNGSLAGGAAIGFVGIGVVLIALLRKRKE